MAKCPQCESDSVVSGSFGGGFTSPTLLSACLKCGLFWIISERDGMVIKRLPVTKDFRKKYRKKILKKQGVPTNEPATQE
ncbi:MAG: hypothetical protein ACFFCD_11875 [Promethearchaeota archaeon]